MLNTTKLRSLAAGLADLQVNPDLTDDDIVKVRETITRRGFSFSQALVLDDKPGIVGYSINGKEWHWKLRQARNRGAFERGWRKGGAK